MEQSFLEGALLRSAPSDFFIFGIRIPRDIANPFLHKCVVAILVKNYFQTEG